MTREDINALCRGFPGAENSDPWGGGHDCWKVGGKMFAIMGAATPGISVKVDSIETAEMLIEAGVGQRPKYLHRSWILLPLETPAAEMRDRLVRSYSLIRAALPKKVRAALGPEVVS